MRASAGRHQQVRLAEVLHLHSQEGNICPREGKGRSSSCVSHAIRIRFFEEEKSYVPLHEVGSGSESNSGLNKYLLAIFGRILVRSLFEDRIRFILEGRSRSIHKQKTTSLPMGQAQPREMQFLTQCLI